MAQQEWLYGLHAMQSVLEKEPERVMEAVSYTHLTLPTILLV